MTVIVKSKAPLVVPPSVRRRAGLKNGDKLEFKVSSGVITILPKPAADDEETPAQREVIARDLAKGLADIRHGRLQGPFASHQEFIATLHRDARKLSTKKPKRRVR
jgi:bifunctional DNA-binding transcriptional regulator/antitoxin component of YhaV-PrlF toxin-antitoxin module